MRNVAETVTRPLIRIHLCKMLNHHCTKYSKVSVSIIFTFIHILVTNYVTGFRDRRMMVPDDVSCYISDATRDVPHLNSGANDVMYTRRDVTDQQVPCPTDCECFWLYPTHLQITCKNRTTNTTSLSHEINVYLSSTASNVTELELSQTPLREIPESICHLKQLTTLGTNLSPFLTRLPDNCFTRLHQLTYFASYQNGLTSLQSGVFDNLTNLFGVFFNYNNITTTDAHLFDVTANLHRLEIINLQSNELTEIDSWPVRRAQLINGTKIDLSHNRISRFSNSLGWHYDCNSPPLLSPTIDLTFNDIRHLNDLFEGWNITGLYVRAFFLRFTILLYGFYHLYHTTIRVCHA